MCHALLTHHHGISGEAIDEALPTGPCAEVLGVDNDQHAVHVIQVTDRPAEAEGQCVLVLVVEVQEDALPKLPVGLAGFALDAVPLLDATIEVLALKHLHRGLLARHLRTAEDLDGTVQHGVRRAPIPLERVVLESEVARLDSVEVGLDLSPLDVLHVEDPVGIEVDDAVEVLIGEDGVGVVVEQAHTHGRSSLERGIGDRV